MTFIACAAMLASAVAMTSCNNDEPQAKHNGETVTTDINIAFPSNATGGAMRMPGATVQVNNGSGDFQGITNLILVPFATKDSIEGTDTRLGANIVLAGVETSSGQAQDLGTASNAKLYTGKQVPVGTSSFLIYGQSAATGDEFHVGKLTGSYGDNAASQFNFILTPIQANSGTVTGSTAHTGLLAYLNGLANATDENGKAWKEYTTGDNQGFAEMWATLATKTNLNSFNVERMASDLLKAIKLNNNDTLAAHIRVALCNPTYVTVNADTTAVTLNSAYANFPENLDLPRGSVAVVYDTTTKSFISSVQKEFAGMNVAPVDQYTYPSSLWYTVNSTISVSDTLEAVNYNNSNDWATILTKYQKANGSVNTKTRSIAVEDKIQYAVARLDVRIKAAETLTDNNPEKSLNQITNSTGYQLTSVLIGGQKNVGYDFKPTSYTGSPVYTIYDTVMTSTIKANPSDYSSANSTLVLETAANTNVYVAIELLNNSGKDFYGADGIIPANGKFYMIGQLDASAATQTGGKVFAQDFTTTARFTIGNLKKAYNGLPDLKTPELEVGLSVDLTWQAGHTYDIIIE